MKFKELMNEKKESNYDKIHKAIERLTKSHVVSVQDEAKGYAYKLFKNNKWGIVDFSLINDLALLGNADRSLL